MYINAQGERLKRSRSMAVVTGPKDTKDSEYSETVIVIEDITKNPTTAFHSLRQELSEIQEIPEIPEILEGQDRPQASGCIYNSNVHNVLEPAEENEHLTEDE